MVLSSKHFNNLIEHHTPKPKMLLVLKQKGIVYHACSQNLFHATVSKKLKIITNHAFTHNKPNIQSQNVQNSRSVLDDDSGSDYENI